MQKHYIDIFDDGLYENDPALEDEASREAIQLIRMQSLWAILFDGQVVVPEQWAISSPAFFDIAAEIGDAFHQYLLSAKTTDVERARAVVAPPVMIGLSSNVADYRSALIDRLAVIDRPIQGLQRLNASRHEDAGAARDAMVKALREWRSEGDPVYQSAHLGATLSTLLGNEKLGVRIASTIGYAGRVDTSAFRAAPYEPAFGSELGKLRSFVFSDRPLNHVFGNDIRVLRDFFLRMDRDRVGMDDPSAVIRLLGNYAEAERERILHVGRLSVHNALAEISRCTVGSITYDVLANDRIVEFDRLLVDETGVRLQPELGAEPDLGAFEQSFFYGRRSDVHRFFDWSAIWPSVFRLSYSQEWAQQRKAIARRMADLPLQKRWDHETWDDLFDKITGKLATVEMKRDDNDRSAFRIGVAPSSLKKIETVGAALSAASAAAAFTTSVPAVLALSIPIGALGALFYGLSKVSDSRLVTQAALGGRRVARKVRGLF